MTGRDKKITVAMMASGIASTLFAFSIYASSKWITSVEAQLQGLQAQGTEKTLDIREVQLQLRGLAETVNRIDSRTEKYLERHG